jgi:hypothetical protein
MLGTTTLSGKGVKPKGNDNVPVSASQLINGGFTDCIKNEFLARQYLSGSQVGFIHYNGFPLIGGAIFDILFNLAFPANAFSIVSMTQLLDTVFLSLTPTFKPRPGSAAVPITGNEEWFPMTSASFGVAGSTFMSFIRLNGTFNKLYLSHGTDAGAGPALSIVYFNDANVSITGGPWAQ